MSSVSSLIAGMEQEARVVGGPVVGDDLRGHPVDVLDVAGQPAAGEGLLHDPAVIHVLVEVEQHQAAVEERADDRLPALLAVVLVLVREHRLGGVGSQCGDGGQRRCLGEMQRAVLAVHLQQEVRTVAEGLDQVAHHRQSGVAQHRLETAAGRRVGHHELRPVPLAQPFVQHSHPRDRVHRRGEPAASLIEQVLRGTDRGHQRSWATGTAERAQRTGVCRYLRYHHPHHDC